MKYPYISFDLQGTLTERGWSDSFWQEYLPRIYEERLGLKPGTGSAILSEKFKQYGRYDARYYSLSYWMRIMEEPRSAREVLEAYERKPLFYVEWLPLIQKLQRYSSLFIVSSTTQEFIDYELGDYSSLFLKRYSTLDDFSIPGKPVEAYHALLSSLAVSGEYILHIGDDLLFDGEHARAAGLQTLIIDPRNGMERALQAVNDTLGW